VAVRSQWGSSSASVTFCLAERAAGVTHDAGQLRGALGVVHPAGILATLGTSWHRREARGARAVHHRGHRVRQRQRRGRPPQRDVDLAPIGPSAEPASGLSDLPHSAADGTPGTGRYITLICVRSRTLDARGDPV